MEKRFSFGGENWFEDWVIFPILSFFCLGYVPFFIFVVVHTILDYFSIL